MKVMSFLLKNTTAMQTKTATKTPTNVAYLYDLTGVTRIAGIQDYTEGIYHGDKALDYATAQKNQHTYLLNEIGVEKDFRLLDVGCGLGTLLETAQERGVRGVGITISSDQASKCKKKGLDVHLLNYKDIPYEWDNTFDGIIANGSLEHFCQPEDALQGRQNTIYREMFKIFARLIDPDSPQKRVVTTAIHFRHDHMDPKKLLRNPFLELADKTGFYASILHRGYGGYYPVKGQLEKCAEGIFAMIKEVDGTEDYRITSEYWCERYINGLRTMPDFRKKIAGHFLRRPRHTLWTVLSFVGLEAWPWQFRGPDPPAILYRHTWQLKEKR